MEKNLNNIAGLIGIARKAGYVVIGGENLSTYTKKLYLFLLDLGAGNSLKREVNFAAAKRKVPVLIVEGLGAMVGIDSCKAIGIKNKAFSEQISKMLKGE